MTTADNQQEPSMEEILSSIRRIIADEQEESDESGNAAADSGTIAPAETETLAEETPAQLESEGEDDDVFDLTDVVGESQEAGPEPVEQPADDLAESLFDDFDPPAEPESTEPPPIAEIGAEPLVEPEPVELAEDLTDTLADEVELSETDIEMSEEAERSSTDLLTDEESEPAPREEHVLEAQAVAQHVENSLVSDATAMASAGSLARLAKVAAGDRDNQVEGGGKSVEEFMAELVRPMLKEWLDANLNSIVERVVEQEVKKLVRRAELM